MPIIRNCSVAMTTALVIFLCLATEGLTARIFRGEAVKQVNNFPFIVLLESDSSLCTGSLVSKTKVLSAGHCVCDKDNMKYAYFGVTDTATGMTNNRRINVLSSVVNINYTTACSALINKKKNIMAVSGYDMAMLQLKKNALIFNSKLNIKPIILNFANKPTIGTLVRTLGYGKDGYVKKSKQIGILKTGHIYVTRCYERIPNAICANHKQSVIAQMPGVGDSGGPLLDSKNQLVGTVSGELRYEDNTVVDVFASIHDNYEFIKNAL